MNNNNKLKIRNDEETIIKTQEKLVELGIEKSLDQCYEEYVDNKKHLKSYKLIKNYIKKELHSHQANPYCLGRYYCERVKDATIICDDKILGSNIC